DRSRIGLLPQDFTPPKRLTARELVAYYAGLYPFVRSRDVDAVLDDVGLDDASKETRYVNLSGGQKRRTCVAAAIVNQPDVIFLDEPTTGIDPAGREAMWRLIEGFDSTVFLTTHNMEEAERLADRVALIDDGELVAVGTPSELIEEHAGDEMLVVETRAP
ncbi:MAG: ABC transporter ATP-binding protein, partial [Halobacteria archaeon]|nr:ABC transporter ATP-binding protein [Halobacteria archaeon]